MLDFSSINPGDIRGAGFDISKNVEEAKKSLESFHDYRVKKVSVNFEDSKWIFNEEFTRSNVVFDYTMISHSLKFCTTENKFFNYLKINLDVI